MCPLTFKKTFQKFTENISHDSPASNSTEVGTVRQVGKAI